MTKKNILFLLTDNYPISAGEFFLSDEMHIIANRFEHVIVVTKKQEESAIKHFIPENMKIYTYAEENTYDKIKAIPSLFTIFFIRELFYVIDTYKINQYFLLFKIMYMDVVRAIKLKSFVKMIRREYETPKYNLIHYSYWNDYKALALTLLKNKNPKSICVSRAHGWDVFLHRHAIPYLPFKKHIIKSLDQTFSVSEAGKSELQRSVGNDMENKISVSKLGKINTKMYRKENKTENIIFCSCGNLIPIKRVHLIIDILKEIKLENIHWIHFGDGPLRKKVEAYAKKQIPNVNFCLKGIISNTEILNFYHQNYIDLFINVSESEGLPFSIIEALSAGIPVLATNVGGTSEVVNRDIGFLIEKDFNSKETATLIKNFIQSSNEIKNRYRNHAYLFWQENYNAEKNFIDFTNRLFQFQTR